MFFLPHVQSHLLAYLHCVNQSKFNKKGCLHYSQIAVSIYLKLRRQESIWWQSRGRTPDGSDVLRYHFKLECPFLLRLDCKKQQNVQGRPLNMIWRRSFVFEGAGTAAGHRATTNNYIVIQQCPIQSPIEGTYVPVIHRFLYRGGEDTPTSEKALTQRKPRCTRLLIVSPGCRNPTVASAQLFQPSLCHRSMTSSIRSKELRLAVVAAAS